MQVFKMSEIKIKRIVSFSSEDKIHKAENLLMPETYKRRNCATPGEKNAIVILQFEKATEIHSVDIQNDGSAFIEVLVRRSSDHLSNYQALLVASPFMNPLESQAGIFTNRVEMFGPDKLAQNLKDQKWDYVKVVCTQPFNKSTTYGLTFIKFHSPSEKLEEQPKEPETKTDSVWKRKYTKNNKDLAEPPTKKASPTLQTNEENTVDKDVLKMHDPFDKETSSTIPKNKEFDHKDIFEKEGYNNSETAAVNSGLHSSGTQPVQQVDKKKPFNQIMCKVNFVLSGFVNPLRSELRCKALEMGAKYREDWNSSCTHLVCAFANTPKYTQVQSAGGKIITKKWILDCYKKRTLLPWEEYELGEDEEESSDVVSESEEEPVTIAGKTIKSETSKYNVQKMSKKKPFNQIMSKVVFVLSGFVNSLRSKLRNKALKMGAKYRGDWNSSCTHLVCAFVNTPKYVKVQRAGGKIVTKKWILDCYKKKAPLPWEKYELGEDKEESSDVTSESEEESVAVPWKTIKPETSKYNGSKNDPANILNTSLLIKQEIETEEEDAVQDCVQTMYKTKTSVQTNSDAIKNMKFIGSKNDPTSILNASPMVKQEIETEDKDAVQVCIPETNVQTNSGTIRKKKFMVKQEIETEDEDAVQVCIPETNVQMNSGAIRKRKFMGSKNDPTKILTASLMVKQEIETEDEDAVHVCIPETKVATNSGAIRKRKFMGSKGDPTNILNASPVVKEEVETEDEDAVQVCIPETNVQTNSGTIRKKKFMGSRNDSANILNASLVIKEEFEIEDEDDVQDSMADTNVQTNSDVMTKIKFTGITKEEKKVMKNADEDKSSNWGFSNLCSKNDPGNNFNYSVAIKEEIETEDEDAVQDYMANTNTKAIGEKEDFIF